SVSAEAGGTENRTEAANRSATARAFIKGLAMDKPLPSVRAFVNAGASTLQQAPGSLQRLWRVDIEGCALPYLHVDHVQPFGFHPVPRARVALQPGDCFKERAWQDYRVAALAVAGGAHHCPALRLAEGICQPVEIGGRGLGHVPKNDQCTRSSRGKR